MISILIPVYNYDIIDLVQNIHKQINKISEKAEIIVVDDASNIDFPENKAIEKFDSVKYIKLTENYGRAKVRNYLASLAQNEYLLFIDCDAKVINIDFIKDYIRCIKEGQVLVCGGLVYGDDKPQDQNLYLRWYYGMKREYKKKEIRKSNPYNSFSSFNFLIKKDIFLSIKFNENISGYGHEDTLLGIDLKKLNIPLMHIDNHLLHDGLEDTESFLKKTRQSVENLKYLIENYENKQLLKAQIKLVKYIEKVRKYRSAWFMKFVYYLLNKIFCKNLLSKYPSLFIFDLYKICYFFSLH